MTTSAIAPVSLVNLSDGAAVQAFEDRLEEVLENILDPSTAAEKPRSITLKIVFDPTKDRCACTVEVHSSCKLQPSEPDASVIYVGLRNGRPTAVQADPDQPGLFDEEPARSSGGSSFGSRKPA